MLAQPFLGALLILHRVSWTIVPVLAAVLLVFLIREPLIVLARQKWVWRDPQGERPETAHARRYVLLELLGLASAGAWLLAVWPFWWIAVLGAGAGALTALAVFITLRNRQRAIWFQALSAAGLSASGIAACLAVTGGVPAWGWWWWGLHAAHFFAGILVVHVRLEARIAARKGGTTLTPEFLRSRRDTALIQSALAVVALTIFALGKLPGLPPGAPPGSPWYGAALMLSAAWHFYNLYTAHTPASVAMPMTSVGQRALVASIVFTLLVAAGAVLGG